jgi:hypothetical protein
MLAPHHEGFAGKRRRRSRFSQTTNRAKAGTKNPWEKFGSCHH